MSSNDFDKTVLKEKLWEVVEQFCESGPGFAQESLVLREVAKKLEVNRDVKIHQMILDCWQDLFRQGKLNWGYDLDNPGAPFFHKAS